MREEKRKEMNNSKEMKKKGKEINYLVYVWKQRENSEGKKKRKECISFSFVWFAIRKEIKGKYMFFFVFVFLCPHKCKRCIKVMDKYVILCHII